MYLNYYEKEVNDADDNKPIGIILCTDKESLTVEYALGGLSSNIFASQYTLYIPDKDVLIAELGKVLYKLGQCGLGQEEGGVERDYSIHTEGWKKHGCKRK